MSNVRKYVLLPVSVMFSMNSFATNVDYGVSSTVASYTNINRSPGNTPDEQSFAIAPFISIQEDSSKLLLNLDARTNQIYYNIGLNGDQNVTNLAASGTWKVNPGQFEWFLSDIFTQTAINPSIPNGLNNRQDVNVLETGPNFIFRLAARESVRVEVRLQNSIFEIAGADNTRYIVRNIYAYDLTSYFSYTANYDLEIINFDDLIANTDSIRHDAYLTAVYTRARDRFDAELGFTFLDFDDVAAQDLDFLRYRFLFTRQFSRLSDLQLIFNRSLEDVSRNLTGGLVVNPGTPVANASSSDFFLNENARLVYRNNHISWGFTAEAFFNSLLYRRQTNLSRDESGVLLRNNLTLSGRSSLGLDLEYRNLNYDDPVSNNGVPTINKINTIREDTDALYRLSYNYRLRRNMTLSFQAINEERKSTVSVFSFQDTRFFLSLTYTSG